MAHLSKYTMSAVGHMLKHYDRAKDEFGEYVKFGNREIDIEKTPMNYNLISRPEGSFHFLKKRLLEVQKVKRANINVMCDWVLTLPQDFEFDYRDFFQYAFDFLSDRYGIENVICANVHLDETQPHIHFAFVPVLDRDNEQILSAKDRVNRADLRGFHKQLDKFMAEKFGKEIGIINDATREKNKSIDELKGETISQLREENRKLKAELEKYKSATIDIKDDKSTISEPKEEQQNPTKPSMPELFKTDSGRRNISSRSRDNSGRDR